MARSFSPDRPRYTPEEQEMRRSFNPNTSLYDWRGGRTGAKIGGRRNGDDGGRYPTTAKLELGTLGAEKRAPSNPFETRMDRVAAAHEDGTFAAKRDAYNAAYPSMFMDEKGNRGPRAPGTGGSPSGAPAATGGRLVEHSGGLRWETNEDRERYKAKDKAKSEAMPNTLKALGGFAEKAGFGAGSTLARAAAASPENMAAIRREMGGQLKGLIDNRPAGEALADLRKKDADNDWRTAIDAQSAAFRVEDRSRAARAQSQSGDWFRRMSSGLAAAGLDQVSQGMQRFANGRVEQAEASESKVNRAPSPSPTPTAKGSSPAPMEIPATPMSGPGAATLEDRAAALSSASKLAATPLPQNPPRSATPTAPSPVAPAVISAASSSPRTGSNIFEQVINGTRAGMAQVPQFMANAKQAAEVDRLARRPGLEKVATTVADTAKAGFNAVNEGVPKVVSNVTTTMEGAAKDAAQAGKDAVTPVRQWFTGNSQPTANEKAFTALTTPPKPYVPTYTGNASNPAQSPMSRSGQDGPASAPTPAPASTGVANAPTRAADVFKARPKRM